MRVCLLVALGGVGLGPARTRRMPKLPSGGLDSLKLPSTGSFLGFSVRSILGGPKPNGLGSPLQLGVIGPSDGVYGPGDGSLDAPESDILRAGFSSRFTAGGDGTSKNPQNSTCNFFLSESCLPNGLARFT